MDGHERRLLIDSYHPFIPESMMVPHRVDKYGFAEGGMKQRSWGKKKRRRKKSGQAKISADKKKLLYDKQNGRCFYCSEKVSLAAATKDHRVPLSKGGRHNMDNLVMACRQCNVAKGSMSEAEFIERKNKSQ